MNTPNAVFSLGSRSGSAARFELERSSIATRRSLARLLGADAGGRARRALRCGAAQIQTIPIEAARAPAVRLWSGCWASTFGSSRAGVCDRMRTRSGRAGPHAARRRRFSLCDISHHRLLLSLRVAVGRRKERPPADATYQPGAEASRRQTRRTNLPSDISWLVPSPCCLPASIVFSALAWRGAESHGAPQRFLKLCKCCSILVSLEQIHGPRPSLCSSNSRKRCERRETCLRGHRENLNRWRRECVRWGFPFSTKGNP